MIYEKILIEKNIDYPVTTEDRFGWNAEAKVQERGTYMLGVEVWNEFGELDLLFRATGTGLRTLAFT
jgi:hypothetical protein